MRLTPRSSSSSSAYGSLLPTALATSLFLSSSAVVSAANITINIGSTAHAALPSILGASTHATLHSSGPALSAPLRRDNTFAFGDVAPGSYLLSVHSRDYAFENLRVDVAVEKGDQGQEEVVRAWQTFRGNEWDNRGEKRGEGRGGRATLEVRVLGGKEYYVQRAGFSPISFLKNPMILMGLFSLVLIVGMPYLMDNMDEETRAEFEEMQKKSPLASAGNPAAQLQNFDLASFLAGKTNQDQQQEGSKQGAGERSGGGGGGARRRG